MIKESADKLAADRTSRGDLKILSRALREFRWAFKVSRPIGRAEKSPYSAPLDPALRSRRINKPSHSAARWRAPRLAGRAYRRRQRIMEAGHFGAGRENSMGLNIMLPFEQTSNPVIAGDSKLVHMKYFFTRKLMFVKECDAVCLLPGGFGTLDEGLEVLTLCKRGNATSCRSCFWTKREGAAGRISTCTSNVDC